MHVHAVQDSIYINVAVPKEWPPTAVFCPLQNDWMRLSLSGGRGIRRGQPLARGFEGGWTLGIQWPVTKR